MPKDLTKNSKRLVCYYMYISTYAITSCQKSRHYLTLVTLYRQERAAAGGSLAHVHGHTVLVTLSVLSIMSIIQC